MGSRVLIVCEGFTADFSGHAVPGSYFVRLEERPGGVTVLWSDDPDDAAAFDDLAAAEAFSRQDPLTLFEVSFTQLADSDQAPTPAPPCPPSSASLAEDLRDMGLM